MVTFSQQTPTGTSQSARAGGMNKKLLPPIVVAAVAILLFSSIYYFWRGRGSSFGSTDYHAVFLTNNQVYFGKIAGSNDEEVVLRDVFYLILRRPAQVQGQTPEATLGAQPVGESKFILVRRGEREVHQPKDELRINRDQILFMEPLREDSKVIQGIRDYKAKRAQEAKATGE